MKNEWTEPGYYQTDKAEVFLLDNKQIVWKLRHANGRHAASPQLALPLDAIPWPRSECPDCVVPEGADYPRDLYPGFYRTTSEVFIVDISEKVWLVQSSSRTGPQRVDDLPKAARWVVPMGFSYKRIKVPEEAHWNRD